MHKPVPVFRYQPPPQPRPTPKRDKKPHPTRKVKKMTTHSAKAKSHKKAKGFIMTNRDKAILLLVYLYRALSNLQIYLLLFQGRDRTRGTERTKGLCENGYLEEVKQYILEGKGKNPTVYTLTQLGAELIGAEDWSPKDSLFKPLFLNHLLRTNDVRIAITLAVQACGGELRGWMDERELGRK